MGRTVAILWHSSFSVAAGVLYFFAVLPRWYELTGNIAHNVGTAGRIACGVVIALAALPVVFTLLRTRKPEYGTPQLALSLRTWSIVAHLLAGALIVGTATSEIWLSLDAVGQWLFGIYGAAAAIAILGIFGFYLSFVAQLPPRPPKPLKSKGPKQRRRHRQQTGRETAAEVEAEGAPEATEGAETQSDESTADQEPAQADAKSDEPEPGSADTAADDTTRAGLRNRRPSGKASTSRRRRRSRGGVAVED